MFGGDQQTPGLVSFDPGAADTGDEDGVFSIRLFAAAPAGILCYVEDWRPGLQGVGADRFVTDSHRHLFRELLIPGSAETNGLGKDGGSAAIREPMHGFYLVQGRNAEA